MKFSSYIIFSATVQDYNSSLMRKYKYILVVVYFTRSTMIINISLVIDFLSAKTSFSITISALRSMFFI